MRRHGARREPRAHWLLFLLAVVVLAYHARASAGTVARGTALGWSQAAGHWLAVAIQWIVVAGTALALLRLAVQVFAARRHARRSRRPRDLRRYLDSVSIVVPTYNEAANIGNRGGLLGRWQHLEYVVGFNLDRRLFDLGECMPTIPGAIGAFRREALRDVGGVPGDTLAEDTDLTMTVLRAGWRAVYAERAVAWTEAPSSLRQLWRQRYRWCYGTMQAAWKHRGAVLERGGGGRLGRRGVLYLLLFQMLLPLAAPLVDVYAIYGALFLPWAQVAAVWCGFTVLQMATTAYALRLDGERLAPLWSVPLQQVIYRQLLYLVVVQGTVAALLGGRQRWRAMARTGLAAPAR
ncbi:glycosyltransferase family 2 protein [Dactylosporangium sp. NPDC000555]|uniref:glycosyltransferase family 2 protein n=1 Tax=Dactylosporangium sp. NPDC000555 TaxID=3154260 RepID=UPI0033274B54